MRKKSHLSLAGFLVQGMDNEVRSRRWRSFYLGNILPDCKPSFVTVRHEYDKTFDLMAEMLRASGRGRRIFWPYGILRSICGIWVRSFII